MDVGGTKVALRVEADGERTRERVFRWRARGVEADLAQISFEVTTLGQQAGGIDAVGIALPATVGPDGVVSAWPSRPEWTGLNVRQAFGSLFGDLPLQWADDGDLGALAEAQAAGCDDVLYVGVGTGVGGGLIVGGVRWPPPGRGSFEVGHVVTDVDGPECQCGRRGCLQATASGPATLDRAARLRHEAVSYEELRLGVLAAEEWAMDAVALSCHRLAVAIIGIQELVHPDLVVVGGGFATGLPGYTDAVARHVESFARAGVPSLPVRRSRYGGFSTLHGAVALARLPGTAAGVC
jgi:kanosamine 6-kinase